MSRNPTSALDYMRPSPVRGQLDPYDPKAPEGWRYIQTTDTPSELKVLLPPGTAAMYEQLLKLETYELTRKSSISWERIMEIRHLKDRMIRKCQRLAKPAQGSRKLPRGEPFVFQTIVAPSDFRLKEMEKWFRDQQKRVAESSAARKPSTSRQDTHANSSHHQLRLSIAKPPLLLRSTTETPQPKDNRASGSHHPRASRPERTKSLPAASAEVPASASVLSPLPLPVLLLSQREEYGLDLPPEPPSEKPVPLLPALEGPSDESSGERTPEEPGQEDNAGKPHLRRRRSCIKRSSMSDLAKRVSWADAQDLDKQLTRYADIAKEVQASGTWEEIRSLYIDQIRGLENLHEQVKEGLENLRLESEHLQRIDGTIHRQRTTLEQAFKEFEDKYVLFQAKVQAALTETTDTLARANTKPGLPPIHEN